MKILLGPKLIKTEVPRFVTLGKNVLENISSIINDLHLGKNCVIITEKNISDKEYQILDSVKTLIKNMEKTNRKVNVVELISSNLRYIETELHDEIINLKPNFIMIIGDGYSIESIKYLMTKLPKHIEWVSIPTSPVHDGFASPFIFLKEKNKGEMFHGYSKPPVAIIVDTKIIENASSRKIKSGIGILLSKFSSNWDWKLASRLRSEPISDFTTLVTDELVKLQANKLSTVHEILKGQIITGFLGSFSNNIRASYGSEHMFAQALDDLIPNKTYRGERVALGTILMSSLQGQDWRQIRSYYKSAGLSVTAKELGIKSSTIIKALMNAIKYPNQDNSYYTILGEHGLTEDAAFRLVYRTGIIGDRPGLE